LARARRPGDRDVLAPVDDDAGRLERRDRWRAAVGVCGRREPDDRLCARAARHPGLTMPAGRLPTGRGPGVAGFMILCWPAAGHQCPTIVTEPDPLDPPGVSLAFLAVRPCGLVR